MKFFTPFRISENMRETPEGYLLCIGVPIGRPGEMIYGPGEVPIEVGPDGVSIVSRTAQELFRPETVASFEGKSVTIQHPAEFVSPATWGTLSKGIVQNVRRGTLEQQDDLVADLLITDQRAISLVKNGLREVSCGYEADYTQTGVGRGFQTNIIGNHLALVAEGRAGSSYAINDHKGKGTEMTLKEKIAKIFGTAQADAIKLVETTDAANVETPETVKGFVSVDDFKKWGDDFAKKMCDAMSEKKAGDASVEPANTPAKPVAKDADDPMTALSARLEKLEAMVAKLAGTGDADGDDEDDDDGESEDEDFGEEDGMTGDSARIEILAPGMNPKAKNAKAKALIAAYQTTDGKKAIDEFTGGKPPDTKNEAGVNMLFIAVSEMLRQVRGKEFSGARTTDFVSQLGEPKGQMTPEKLNELNEKHYGKKSA